MKAGRDTIEVGGDGSIRLVNRPFTIVREKGGNTRLQVNVESLEKIAMLIPHMAAAARLPEERLRQVLSTSPISVTERRPDPVQLDFQFGGHEEIRSAAKACLVLWTTLVGNEEVKGAMYDDVRRFITVGDEEFLSERTSLDARCYDANDIIVSRFGPAFNLIYVKSDPQGRVVGHFTFYNLIAFSVVLAESAGSFGRQIALVSNPITHGWSQDFAEELDLSFEWLSRPTYDYDDTEELIEQHRRRFSPIMNYYLDMANKREINRIVQDVFKRHPFKEGEIFSNEMAKSISGEIAHRVSHHLFNIPYTRPISADQIQAAIFGKPLI